MNEENKNSVQDSGLYNIPSDVLGVEGEDGSMMLPEAGEQIEITVMGEVVGVEGGNVQIRPMSVNGTELGMGAGAPAVDAGEPKEASLEDLVGAYKAQTGSMEEESV
jgi:hypothetical protein